MLVAALVVGACSGAAPSASPNLSASPSPAASGVVPTPTRSFTATPVTTPQEAVARVIAFEPRLAGIKPKDYQLIGQSAWYEVMPASGVGAFRIRTRVGWGDCEAGCIDEHVWTYAVAPDGTVTLQPETGEPVRDALVDAVSALPARLRRSLTWDQGVMANLRVDYDPTSKTT